MEIIIGILIGIAIGYTTFNIAVIKKSQNNIPDPKKKMNNISFKPYSKPSGRFTPIINDDLKAWDKEHND